MGIRFETPVYEILVARRVAGCGRRPFLSVVSRAILVWEGGDRGLLIIGMGLAVVIR